MSWQGRRVAVSGASGFVGAPLVAHLEEAGAQVLRLVRGTPKSADEVQWSTTDPWDPSALEGLDAVIHLAGEPIAAGRWTKSRKERILSSRIEGTQSLAKALAGLTQPPNVLVSASAIGFYGDHGDEVLTHESAPGTDYLAEVCLAWEDAADPARDAGIRVIHPRIGLVLDPSGGALAKMLPPFKFGLGGRLGSGDQWMSWITRRDLVRLLAHYAMESEAEGPVPASTMQPITNKVFTKALGAAIHRPTIFPLPKIGIKVLFGEMGESLFLTSTRVEDSLYVKEGFLLLDPQIEGALRHQFA